MIFDSHAHYDDARFDEDRDTLLPYLHQNGIEYITNIGCDLETSLSSVALSQKYPFIFAAVGFHPEHAQNLDLEALSQIEKLMSLPKTVALGEIGLDYHYDGPSREVQKETFIKQLSLANDLKVPVIIHSRDAISDTLEIVKKYRPQGVVHCFSGSAETAKEYTSMGMYVGITGVVTFSNAKKTLEVAASVPSHLLVIETDCPYLAPVPMRGKRCDSSLLTYTAKAIAKARNQTTDEVIKETLNNAKELYRIKL